MTRRVVHNDADRPVAGLPATYDFSAYADDYTARGEITLRARRLADHLDGADELRVEGVTVRALEDGRGHNLLFAVIAREELCAVAETGPRGSARAGFGTRPYPVLAEVGPYVVAGYVYALPTSNPLASLQRRQVITLSPARIAFNVAGERVEEEHDALLLMREKIELLDSASEDEIGLTQPSRSV